MNFFPFFSYKIGLIDADDDDHEFCTHSYAQHTHTRILQIREQKKHKADIVETKQKKQKKKKRRQLVIDPENFIIQTFRLFIFCFSKKKEENSSSFAMGKETFYTQINTVVVIIATSQPIVRVIYSQSGKNKIQNEKNASEKKNVLFFLEEFRRAPFLFHSNIVGQFAV